MDTGRIVIEAPPDPPVPTPTSPLARLMPVAMIAAMAGMTLLYVSSTDSTTRNPMFLFFPAMMALSLIGTLVHGSRGGGRGELCRQRAEYLRYLDNLDGALMTSAAEQHHDLHSAHPHPAALWTLTGGPRMWDRLDGHPFLLEARIGLGRRPSAVTMIEPALGPADDTDPVTTGALRRLVHTRGHIDDVPVTVPLHMTRVVRIAGAPERALAAARALVCHLAVLHGPDIVRISGPPSQEWDWLKWLPHCGDGPGVRHHVVVTDTADATVSEERLTTVVVERCPESADVAVHCDDRPLPVECDELVRADAVACARRLARHRPDPTIGPCTGVNADWAALMGIDDPDTIDAERLWARPDGPGLLRVPIGVGEAGAIVHLDIKEAAEQGMGPHGLCVGATGSGKSEFLRTLTLGMIAAHSPEDLNLVLVDFKGGATFLGMDTVNHVSAVITNLADEAPLVSRMREALSGEVNRRQEMLRAAGNLTNVAEYRRARARDHTMTPLPALFIIVDEFSELLSRHPDFAEMFVAIGRLGRSLGMHLLLASQRLDEGRLRGLETHLSYRICLKTFSASESRAVLGVPDAYHLSAEPGAAYLKTAGGVLTRFQTAYVSGGYTPRHRPPVEPAAVRRFTAAVDADAPPTPGPQAPTRPLLDAVLARLAGCGIPAHRVWLPPLSRPPALAALLAAGGPRHLSVPIGVVDCPFEQRREPLVVDLASAAGHVAVVGGPRSGKSTTLRTIVTAMAATHDAATVQFYCVDFGGGELVALRELPHVGSVAGRRDGDLCRRTVAQLESVLRHREMSGSREGDGYGDVFLVVDGWASLRQDFEGLEQAITAIAAQGLSYGVHVMIGTSRWADLRPAFKDQIGTRIELRLGDPTESEMDRRRARELVDLPPGRGITRQGREMAIALPGPDVGVCDGQGRSAPPVELLPARVDREAIAAGAGAPGEILLGLGERDLAAVMLNPAEHPHLLVLGDSRCGKTSLLRLLCTELAARIDVQLEIVDYRRTLLGVVENDCLGGYAVSGPAVTSRLAALTEVLNGRMPDESVTQRQLRDRSWWHGPDIYVVVDDYDLVAGATGNPLAPLAEFLPHAQDLGLHVVVARRSGGAARAMFDPVLARMRDMGCAALMMSATPDEGVLLGSVRPTPLPPGRGTLIARGRPDELIQVGWVEPP